MAVDYPRAMAAYKVGGEGGNAACQWQVGHVYYNSLGVDVNYKQALPWIEKAAAQDDPIEAVGEIGTMYCNGQGVTPSYRRAREYYERAIELGHPTAVKNMQTLTESIQNVMSRRSNHFPLSSPLVRDLTLPHHRSTLLPCLARTQGAPLMDKRVEIHGTSRADMNGKRGVATDFHLMNLDGRATWRYTVKLDGGEAFKVKPANVRAEGAGGGAGAGTGTAKGKKGGKKARAGRK